MRHWAGTAFLVQKKRYSKNRSVCKNTVTSLVWELYAPTDGLLSLIIKEVYTKSKFI